MPTERSVTLDYAHAWPSQLATAGILKCSVPTETFESLPIYGPKLLNYCGAVTFVNCPAKILLTAVDQIYSEHCSVAYSVPFTSISNMKALIVAQSRAQLYFSDQEPHT